jgi:hypothetical protein
MYFQLVKELIEWEVLKQIWLREQPQKNPIRMYVILP